MYGTLPTGRELELIAHAADLQAQIETLKRERHIAKFGGRWPDSRWHEGTAALGSLDLRVIFRTEEDEDDNGRRSYSCGEIRVWLDGQWRDPVEAFGDDIGFKLLDKLADIINDGTLSSTAISAARSEARADEMAAWGGL